MLKDIQDEELLHLPDIHAQGKRSEKPAAIQRTSLVSRPFYPANVVVDIKVNKCADTTSMNTLNSRHDHSHTNGGTDLSQRADCKPDEKSRASSVHFLHAPPNASPRLMVNRHTVSQTILPNLHASSKAISSSQTQLHKLGSELVPEKIKPYRKSLSQREFSIEEKEKGLPDIFTHGNRVPVRMPRSSSAVTILPPLPPTLHGSKSKSHTDIPIKCASPAIESSCTFLLTRRLRIRDMWRRAFVKLRHLPRGDEDHDVGDESWVWSSGGFLRPVYSRWSQRRDALAEPERMCMPQVLREQIQKDVQSRRRSMKRRMSKFLNVKLGLNFEEDLSA